jgi:hypothetical protein
MPPSRKCTGETGKQLAAVADEVKSFAELMLKMIEGILESRRKQACKDKIPSDKTNVTKAYRLG